MLLLPPILIEICYNSSFIYLFLFGSDSLYFCSWAIEWFQQLPDMVLSVQAQFRISLEESFSHSREKWFDSVCWDLSLFALIYLFLVPSSQFWFTWCYLRFLQVASTCDLKIALIEWPVGFAWIVIETSMDSWIGFFILGLGLLEVSQTWVYLDIHSQTPLALIIFDHAVYYF